MLHPAYDSNNILTRKLMYFYCDQTGKCYSTKEDALAGSTSERKLKQDANGNWYYSSNTEYSPSTSSTKRNPNEDKDVSEILLKEKKYSPRGSVAEESLSGSGGKVNCSENRLTRNKSLSELLGAV